MKDETASWLAYADENLNVARLALQHGHLNSCLQNAQQAVEKYLKALIIEKDLEFRRTHSIRELTGILSEHRVIVDISDDDMDFMDSIYLPSKYPVHSALPDAMPDKGICREALLIAEKMRMSIIDDSIIQAHESIAGSASGIDDAFE